MVVRIIRSKVKLVIGLPARPAGSQTGNGLETNVSNKQTVTLACTDNSNLDCCNPLYLHCLIFNVFVAILLPFTVTFMFRFLSVFTRKFSCPTGDFFRKKEECTRLYKANPKDFRMQILKEILRKFWN